MCSRDVLPIPDKPLVGLTTHDAKAQVYLLSRHGALCLHSHDRLTCRNHHSVGLGGITEITASAPGYNLHCRTERTRLSES